MNEHVSALLAAGLFGIAAVAIILYQHAHATNTVLTALGGSQTSGSGAGQYGNAIGILGVPASLAGMPTVGQAGSAPSGAVVPMTINPGYTIQ